MNGDCHRTQPGLISFIVPAHNEEQFLGKTLTSIHRTMAVLGEPYEIVVANDASTDATARIAAEQGARVVNVAFRHISATRNAGARAARGELLFFVDADTLADVEAVGEALKALRAGAAGGGCVFRFDGRLPLWGKVLCPLGAMAGRWLRLVGGCFLFCTRQAFEAVGGFSEKTFAAEELALTQALKKQGRFVVPRHLVVTSGRKLGTLTEWEGLRLLFKLCFRLTVFGAESFRRRDEPDLLLDLLYGVRGAASRKPASPTANPTMQP